jgi:septal ring factor EnvC (AmiA/AmiB activator)
VFQVLCNAARADKTRLQQLEVEVARFSHRAETAESEKLELQAQLQQLQVDTHSLNAAVVHLLNLARQASACTDV